MSKNKGKYIFELAKVQCLHCGRFFVEKMHHKCTGGYRKHHHEWIELKQE
jgi:hypothetical protein